MGGKDRGERDRLERDRERGARPAGAAPKDAPPALAPGLHLVATPLGNARDITLRTLDILREAEVLVAEDTRTLRRLLDIHGIGLGGRPLLAWHEHSDARTLARVLAHLQEGRSVAYAPEAGTPSISDPGYRLVNAALAAELPLTAAPGPSAALAALVLSGLPTDRFLFCGFPPARGAERRRWLHDLTDVAATLILYESPRRIHQTLADLVQIAGEDRRAALCRELTKRFEEIIRGPLRAIVAALDGRELQGEIVLVVDRADASMPLRDIDDLLREALAHMTIRDAVDAVAAAADMPRRTVYQAALRISGEGE